ncbi:mannose-6-phosphate isomerase, class I [Actinopolymorpha alba]|uniref:mannose-6-phosphate isomerase, class I n=1 Tax=Actinopolymorpha alba TaxID=533267 RepID=UPI00038275E2|nr:mannose-6-phosphate isomerase, class I [Actinopolymorpha alba]
MHLLDNPIRPYVWGSPSAIPELLGVEPTGEPQAELWMGAHPSSPSFVPAQGRSLVDLIAADPEGELGEPCLSAFGPRLPFLLKLLAAREPLSLQAHPDPEQAREGYERENADGIPIGAPHRNYKDADAKPELICALTPFEALVGFRPPAQTLEVADRLGVPELDPLLAQVREQPDGEGLRAAFTMLMTAPVDHQRAVVEAVLDACRSRRTRDLADLPAADLLVRLAEKYPGDPGVVAALLLNHVHLEPGESLYLPAGNLHAYVEGLGVEILANSDNVLRGGLTSKHIDLPELLRILDFTPRSAEILRAGPGGVYDTPAREFQLARLDISGGSEVTVEPAGPQILLCVEGRVVARSESGKVELTPGYSAYAGAGEGVVALAGAGTVFRATAGLGAHPA